MQERYHEYIKRKLRELREAEEEQQNTKENKL